MGFIGFVKIHELPAEKILPFWFRHYFCFAKPIHYITDEEYKFQHQKKGRKVTKSKVESPKKTKIEIKELKRKQKQEKLLEKAKKKYGIPETNLKNKEIIKQETNNNQENKESELSQKLS